MPDDEIKSTARPLVRAGEGYLEVKDFLGTDFELDAADGYNVPARIRFDDCGTAVVPSAEHTQ